MSTRPLSNWMFGLAGMVAGMVTVGGITRLTRSGLSMTDWKIQGSLPPMNAEEWEKEFQRWKTFPEAQQRKDLTVDDFKFIYFWEYGHRMLGRTVGLAFTLPFVYFAARGMIPRALYPRLGALFTLGGTQGLIGWWMVKSGLEMDPAQQREIRVSPYRLATHLTMAFTTYSLLLWTALELRLPKNMYNINSSALRSTMASTAAKFTRIQMNRAVGVRKVATAATAIVAATAFTGAFVAGNDAGRAYNTFPKMGDEWVPDTILELQPMWRNFFENTACVQFDHRILALSSMAAVTSIFLTAYPRTVGSTTLRRSAPEAVGKALKNVGRMTFVQVSLGVSTLLLYVPTELAVAHQAGAIGMLTFMLRLVHSLNYTYEPLPADVYAPLSVPSKHTRDREPPIGDRVSPFAAVQTTQPFSTLCEQMRQNRVGNGAMLDEMQRRSYHTARVSFNSYASKQQKKV